MYPSQSKPISPESGEDCSWSHHDQLHREWLEMTLSRRERSPELEIPKCSEKTLEDFTQERNMT